MLIARSARAKKRMGLGLESKAGRLKEKCKLLLNGGTSRPSSHRQCPLCVPTASLPTTAWPHFSVA